MEWDHDDKDCGLFEAVVMLDYSCLLEGLI